MMRIGTMAKEASVLYAKKISVNNLEFRYGVSITAKNVLKKIETRILK